MDALSELLRTVKLSGALFFDAHCYAPWCVQAAPSQAFRPFIEQPATHVIEFHVVIEGRGYIRVGNETMVFLRRSEDCRSIPPAPFACSLRSRGKCV